MFVSGPGHEHFRDAPRPDHPPHDGHSPASRERSSSLQGMDMASLPPRKRPWHDGPGTSEHREMEAPGGPSEDRGGKGKWRPVIPVPGAMDVTALPGRLQGHQKPHLQASPTTGICLFHLSPARVPRVLSPVYPLGLRFWKGTCSQMYNEVSSGSPHSQL